LKRPAKPAGVSPQSKAWAAQIISPRTKAIQPSVATLSLVLPRNSTRARVVLQWPGAAPQVVWSGKATRGQKLSLHIKLPTTELQSGNKIRSAQVSVQEARPPIAKRDVNWTIIARETVTLSVR
jgi:hypothetical protein